MFLIFSFMRKTPSTSMQLKARNIDCAIFGCTRKRTTIRELMNLPTYSVPGCFYIFDTTNQKKTRMITKISGRVPNIISFMKKTGMPSSFISLPMRKQSKEKT
jgi:hypothetical protein